MPESKAQKFARRRNWGNARLSGMDTSLRDLRSIATKEEQSMIDDIEEKLLLLRTEWNNYQKAKSELL